VATAARAAISLTFDERAIFASGAHSTNLFPADIARPLAIKVVNEGRDRDRRVDFAFDINVSHVMRADRGPTSRFPFVFSQSSPADR